MQGQSIEVQVNLNHSAQDTGLQILGIPISQIAIAVLVVFVLVYFRLGKKKGGKKVIALVGERQSGKTQMFMGLAGGKQLRTVPSIKNNSTTYQVASKPYTLIDFNGDDLSKQDILNDLNNIHCIVHVIDGTASKQLGAAAMFLYRVLVSKKYQRYGCNYVIALNKKDSDLFMGKEKVKKLIEDEIEHIKTARSNEGQESENEEDYLKVSKTRFMLELPIITISGMQDVSPLAKYIQEL